MRRAVAVAAALLAASCATTRHADAARSAGEHTCDALARCGKVGPGRQYADDAACRLELDAVWSKRWSRDACEGRVDADGLGRCLASIDATDCDSVLDVLNTALNKCAEARVCRAPADPER